MGQAASSPIAPDGSFHLGGLPGGVAQMIMSSTIGADQMGFSIVRIERDGTVMPRGLEVRDGEQMTGLRVFIAHGSATLRGVIKVENGVLPEGAQFFVRLNRPGENNTAMRPPQVDARGHFVIDGLAPGVYELTASVVGGGITFPRHAKREISVENGVVTEVTVTIDLGILKP